MSTTEALKQLTDHKAHQVCLVHGGQFSALVSYDSRREELVFRLINPAKALSVRALLFQTEPAWVL